MAKSKEFEAEYKAEGLRRMKERKAKRLHNFLNPPSWKYRGWQCEMGYSDCNLRRYCNGDC